VFSKGGAWPTMAWVGFAAVGLALSFRTGTPNLAVGQLVSLAGYVYASSDSIALAVLAVLGAGLFMALLVGLTGLPAWAVTFASGMGVSAILISQASKGTVRVEDVASRDSYLPWAIGFVVLSIAGGVLFAFPPVRRFLSANRPAGGEAGTFGGAKLVGALVGIVGSSALAALAGILQARYLGAALPYDTGLLVYAFAAVLLGAVSPFGRRAGVFGVVLGVVIVDFLWQWEMLKGAGSWVPVLTSSLCAIFGLMAIWLIELIGRRASPLVTAPPAAAAPAFAPAGPPPSQFPPAQFPPSGQFPPAQVPPSGQFPPPAVPFGGYAPPPPVSGPPVSGPPVSAPPLPPPVSAPPVPPPVSGPPVGPPGSGGPSWPPPVSPPPGGPSWPPPPPPQ
jgi:ribose transport system permease protein